MSRNLLIITFALLWSACKPTQSTVKDVVTPGKDNPQVAHVFYESENSKNDLCYHQCEAVSYAIPFVETPLDATAEEASAQSNINVSNGKVFMCEPSGFISEGQIAELKASYTKTKLRYEDLVDGIIQDIASDDSILYVNHETEHRRKVIDDMIAIADKSESKRKYCRNQSDISPVATRISPPQQAKSRVFKRSFRGLKLKNDTDKNIEGVIVARVWSYDQGKWINAEHVKFSVKARENKIVKDISRKNLNALFRDYIYLTGELADKWNTATEWRAEFDDVGAAYNSAKVEVATITFSIDYRGFYKSNIDLHSGEMDLETVAVKK